MEPITETQIIVDVDQVELELARHFDLSVRELRDVADCIYRGFVQVTALHPKGFNGTNGWAEGTRQLRAILIPKGWRSDDPQGQPRVVSKDKKTSITVSSGNPDTGIPNRDPPTRNDKGGQTASSVQFNARQGVLFPLIGTSNAPLRALDSKREALWVLLYYIDLDASEMRVELSRPTAMSEADRINRWSPRLILPSVPLAPVVDELPRDESPDIDFDITLKNL
jgi:hypothetical protein